MSLNCPFCHSTDIMIVEANAQQANSTLSNLASPAALGALGTTVAKSLNLPPIVGGIAGTVLGGLFNSFTEQSTPPQQSLCFCHNCYQKIVGINTESNFKLKGVQPWHINLNKWLMSVKPLGMD